MLMQSAPTSLYPLISPNISDSQLEGFIFTGAVIDEGQYSFVPTVTSQYKLCSREKLEFGPPTINLETTHVVDLTVFLNIQDYESGVINLTDIKNEVLERSKHIWDEESKPHHIMVVLPFEHESSPEDDDSIFSFYDADTISSMHFTMRKIGFQLGLTSSSGEHLIDSDITGFMGSRRNETNLIRPVASDALKCFNAEKLWQLGWYQEKHVTINPLLGGLTAWETKVQLASISQYDMLHANDQVTKLIVKIPMSNSVDAIYLFFNVAKGMNAGTGQFVNQVAIVRGSPTTASYALAGLDKFTQPMFLMEDFNNEGGLLVIKCESIDINYRASLSSEPDLAIVSIKLYKTF